MVPGIIAPRVGKLSLYYVPIVSVRALSSVSPSLLWLSRCMLPALLFPLPIVSSWELWELPISCTTFTVSLKLSHVLSTPLPRFPTLFAPVYPSLYGKRGGHTQVHKTDGFMPLSQNRWFYAFITNKICAPQA